MKQRLLHSRSKCKKNLFYIFLPAPKIFTGKSVSLRFPEYLFKDFLLLFNHTHTILTHTTLTLTHTHPHTRTCTPQSCTKPKTQVLIHLSHLLLKSTWMEWSMTRSAGHTGFIFSGSPPSLFTASRIAAKSTTAGTPLRKDRVKQKINLLNACN